MMLLYILNFLLAFMPGERINGREIEKYLNQHLSSYEKIEFEVISAPRVEPGVHLNIDESRQLKLAGNIAYIPVRVVERNGQSSQSLLSVRVKLYRKAVIALVPVKYGTPLQQQDFSEKLVDVAQVRGTAVTEISELSGKKARLNLKPGSILTEDAVQPLPVLKSGERVLAFYQRGSVVITMDAVARQDGCKGDIIRISTNDKKLFRAKIIDENSVKIQE